MIRLGILASARGSNAEAIIEAVRSGCLEAEVCVVITNNPSAGVIARAEEYAIPIEVIPSKGYSGGREEYDALLLATLNRYGVDTVVLAGWMRILSKVMTEPFAGRMVNLHPALLPSFKGARAIEDAYEYGVKITGCSVHMVNGELDGGALIIQAAIPIRGSREDLEASIHKIEHLILPQALQWLSEGRLIQEGRCVVLKKKADSYKRVEYIDGCLIYPPLEVKI